MPMTTARPCFMSFLPPGDLFYLLEVVLLLDLVILGDGLELGVDYPEHHQKEGHPRAEEQEPIPPQQQAQGRPDQEQDIDQRRNDEGEIAFLGPAVSLGGRPSTLNPAHLSSLLSPPRPPGRIAH